MKRRTFFKKVGIAGTAAAVVPGAFCGECTSPRFNALERRLVNDALRYIHEGESAVIYAIRDFMKDKTFANHDYIFFPFYSGGLQRLLYSPKQECFTRIEYAVRENYGTYNYEYLWDWSPIIEGAIDVVGLPGFSLHPQRKVLEIHRIHLS